MNCDICKEEIDEKDGYVRFINSFQVTFHIRNAAGKLTSIPQESRNNDERQCMKCLKKQSDLRKDK